MDANLDALIKLSGLKSLNDRCADVDSDYDEYFLSVYEDILKEASEIKNKPVNHTAKEVVKKKQNKKRIYLVESILDDNDETFVRNIYVKILGREPDRTGYDNHLAKIKSDKNFDREKLIYEFWKSDEGQKRNIEIVGFHKVYMDELISHNGMEFVEHTFLQLLARKPDTKDAQNYYDAIYKQGKSKEEIVRIIKDSDEFKRRKVEIVGFEKAYKSRMRKEKILAKPVIGNAVLAVWNIFHINRRLTEINSEIAESKKIINEKTAEVSDMEEKLTDTRNKLSDAEETIGVLLAEINTLKMQAEKDETVIKLLQNPEADNEYLERLNTLLSSRRIVWGSKDRLHISPKASVYTCFFNTNSGDITIGDYTFAGSNVSILAGSHDKDLKGLPRRDADETTGFDIVIGNGVWLGSNCTILGPATIGDNAVIAAGAVVAPGTDVPANTVYGGIPAKQIGKELNFDNEYSESILRALKRKEGALFFEGWSEKRHFAYNGSSIFGYYLLESTGRVLLEEGTYSLKYAHNADADGILTIDNGENKQEFALKGKEGSLEFDISGKDNRKCRYVVISAKAGDTDLKDCNMAVRIEKTFYGEKE